MEVQVMYVRQVETREGKTGTQMVRRLVQLDLGGDDVAYVQGFWIRTPYDPDHPIEYRPGPDRAWWF